MSHRRGGHWQAVKTDNRLGGYFPESLKKAVEFNNSLRANPFAKTNFSALLKQFETKFGDTTRVFVDFPNVAVYTPVSYMFQVTAEAVLQYWDAGPIQLLYGARIATFMIWLLAMFYTKKICRFLNGFSRLPLCSR
jgi:hypothetical protein